MRRPEPIYGTRDTEKIALFGVARVWKGQLGTTFEMPALEETSACWGFWPELLKVGNDLVYGFKSLPAEPPSSVFITHICSRTWLAKGNKDLDQLGIGYEPQKSTMSQPVLYVTTATVIALAAVLAYFVPRRLRLIRSDSPSDRFS